jgi:hypothetical protein
MSIFTTSPSDRPERVAKRQPPHWRPQGDWERQPGNGPEPRWPCRPVGAAAPRSQRTGRVPAMRTAAGPRVRTQGNPWCAIPHRCLPQVERRRLAGRVSGADNQYRSSHRDRQAETRAWPPEPQAIPSVSGASTGANSRDSCRSTQTCETFQCDNRRPNALWARLRRDASSNRSPAPRRSPRRRVLGVAQHHHDALLGGGFPRRRAVPASPNATARAMRRPGRAVRLSLRPMGIRRQARRL